MLHLLKNQIKMPSAGSCLRRRQSSLRRAAQDIIPAEAHALTQHSVGRADSLPRGVNAQLHEVRLRKCRAVSGIPDIHPPAALQHTRGLGKHSPPVLREKVHEEVKGRHGVEARAREIQPSGVHAQPFEIAGRPVQLLRPYVNRGHGAAVNPPYHALAPAAEVKYPAGYLPF